MFKLIGLEVLKGNFVHPFFHDNDGLPKLLQGKITNIVHEYFYQTYFLDSPMQKFYFAADGTPGGSGTPNIVRR